LSSQTGTKVLPSNSDYLVSTIQAVIATLTIALVWTLVRISWPWHLTQVRVVARRQPEPGNMCEVSTPLEDNTADPSTNQPENET